MKVTISNGRSLHEKNAKHLGVATFQVGELGLMVTVNRDGVYTVSQTEDYTNGNGVLDTRFERVHEGDFLSKTEED
jgi:hypothetical protein